MYHPGSPRGKIDLSRFFWTNFMRASNDMGLMLLLN